VVRYGLGLNREAQIERDIPSRSWAMATKDAAILTDKWIMQGSSFIRKIGQSFGFVSEN